MRSEKRKRNKRPLIIGAAALLLAAVYLGGTAFFGSHFLPKTTIGGTAVGMKDAEAAEALLNEVPPAIEVVQRDCKTGEKVTEKILLADVEAEEVRLDVDGLLKGQSAFRWPLALFKGEELGAGTQEGSLDDAKLTDAVKKLYCLQKENTVKPKEAALSLEEGKLSVTPAEDGCYIKEKTVFDLVKKGIEAYLSGKGTDPVDLTESYEKADADAAEALGKKAEELQPVLDKTISIEIPDVGTLTLSGAELAGLLELGDDNTFKVNEDTMYEYVAEIGRANDVSETEYLDRDALLAELEPALTAAEDRAITAEWIVEEDPEEPSEDPEDPAEEPGDNDGDDGDDSGEAPAAPTSGDLIEVHYNEQMLYFYQDGALAMSSPIVSGNEENGIIPPGTYYVTFMAQGLTLTGADYSDYVDYWIGFDNAAGEWNAGTLIGFHDASWRHGEFGGDIWRTDPSHGCINMPTDKVAFLYANVENGVEIHIMY